MGAIPGGGIMSRYVCTKENPWAPEKGKASHPDAIEIDCQDGWPGGDIAIYKCPNCGLEFECEIAQ